MEIATESRVNRLKVLFRAPFRLRGASLVAIVIVSTLVLAALLAGVIAPHNPMKIDLAHAYAPPAWMAGGGTDHLLGTDRFGRDILSRMIFGTRISLLIGLFSTLSGGILGVTVGLFSGYRGGWVDSVLMRVTDVVLALPFLIIAIALASIFGPSIKNIVLILAVTTWTLYARMIRSEVLRLRTASFVELAKVAGCSTPRILVRHIFPNVTNTFIVLATLQIGAVIITESSLSFLGIGVPPPNPAWGLMVAEGRQDLATAWWISVFPGIAILLTVLSFNMLGDWLRVRLDPKGARQVSGLGKGISSKGSADG